MRTVTTSLQAVPALRSAPGLVAGSLYIAVAEDGAVVADLVEGQRVVLRTAQGETLELTTRASLPIAVTAGGSYLSNSDLESLVDRSAPEIRRYQASDTRRKLLSSAGLLVILPALAALITAIVGSFFIISTSTTSPTADTAQALFQWVSQPIVGNTSAQTASEVAVRAEMAGRCLQMQQHRVTVPVSIPGIACAPDDQWWRSPVAGSLITGAIGVLTAAIGLVALRRRFGFRGRPQDS